MRKQRNEKNEKTEVVRKEWRKQIKTGKFQQVIDGGGVQLGTCEAREVPIEPAQKKNYVYINHTLLYQVYYSHKIENCYS